MLLLRVVDDELLRCGVAEELRVVDDERVVVLLEFEGLLLFAVVELLFVVVELFLVPDVEIVALVVRPSRISLFGRPVVVTRLRLLPVALVAAG